MLHEALDPRTPLLERLKFLAIFSSNLDEFFQVRVAGLKRQVAAGFTERTPDGLTPEDQLARIAVDRARAAGAAPALPHARRAARPRRARRPDHQRIWTTSTARTGSTSTAYFQANVFPVLTPLAVDPGHPFPYISNLSLSLAVVLRGTDGEERFARVKVPKILPRWVPLPAAQHVRAARAGDRRATSSRSSPASRSSAGTFPHHPQHRPRDRERRGSRRPAEPHPGRGAQSAVRRGGAARGARLDARSLRQLLLEEFNDEQQDIAPPLTASDVYEVPGCSTPPTSCRSPALDLPALKDPTFHPVTPARLAQGRNIFDVIREGDVLVHHPYDSFATTVERFIQAAAEDPDVLAIKLTLYRTGGDSSIARAAGSRPPSGASRWRC